MASCPFPHRIACVFILFLPFNHFSLSKKAQDQRQTRQREKKNNKINDHKKYWHSTTRIKYTATWKMNRKQRFFYGIALLSLSMFRKIRTLSGRAVAKGDEWLFTTGMQHKMYTCYQSNSNAAIHPAYGTRCVRCTEEHNFYAFVA